MRCTTHQQWCLSSSVDKSSEAMDETRRRAVQVRPRRSKGNVNMIKQLPGNSGPQFAPYIEDLMLLCEKEAPYRSKMDTSVLSLPRIISASAVAEKQTSEFNLAAPSVHRYQGCHLIWAAHQEWRPQVHLAIREA